MLPFLTLLSVVALSASASSLHPLERNIAYRSPSKTVGSDGLSHDIGAIRRAIHKRAYDERVARQIQARAGNVAESLVQDYNGEYGPDGRDAYKGNISFPFNVASGDPYSDSAILWTHPVAAEETDKPICLRYQTSKSKDDWSKDNVVDDNYAWTTSDVDYSFKVETTGLQPKTEYYYRFFSCNDHSLVSPVGTFKTFPEYNDDDVDSLRLAIFSCSNLPWGFFNAYQKASDKNDIDFWLHVGDYIYEGPGDGSPDAYGDGRAIGRVPEPNKEILTLEDYRTRYQSYRNDSSLQDLHRTHAILAVWDDHELADNTYSHGSADSNNTEAGTIEGVNFTERKRNAVKAYFEWMPIRQVDTTDSLRIWRSFQYGTLADIFMLDTRFGRDITDVYYNTAEIEAISNDTDRSLMGAKQERWLYSNIVESQQRGAVWKIIGQQVIVNPVAQGSPSFPYNYDAWDGYNQNRRRFFDTLTENKVDNTVLIAGDTHANWVLDTIYEEWVNNTDAYDPATGRGSIAVELGGTAVSSPSSYGRNLTPEEYTERAELLVNINRNLQWAEGQYRGYYEIEFNRKEANAQFFGIQNNTLANSDELLLAQFNIRAGANHLTRPVNYDIKPASGALQSSVVNYNSQKWNGTAFV